MLVLYVTCVLCTALLKVYEERAFSSTVRCLAADADSDVVWAGDDSGCLAVLR